MTEKKGAPKISANNVLAELLIFTDKSEVSISAEFPREAGRTAG